MVDTDRIARELEASGQGNTEFLVGRAKDNSHSAWAALIAKHREMLQTHVRIRVPALRRRGLDEDVLQEALMRAFHDIGRFEYRGEGAFRRWLAQIAVNAALNEVRKQRRERAHLEDGGGAVETLPSPAGGDGLADAQQRRLEAMGRLTEEDRDLLVQRHVDGYTFERIGEVQGCSRETARALYQKALERLERHLRRAE